MHAQKHTQTHTPHTLSLYLTHIHHTHTYTHTHTHTQTNKQTDKGYQNNCCYRELMKQHRIRVHINFFVSLVLCSSLTIPWYGLVHHDLLVNPIYSNTVFYRNPVRITYSSGVNLV